MQDDTIYDKVSLPLTDSAPKAGDTPFFLVLLLLVFFPPAAWFIMWKEEDYHKWFGYLIGLYGIIAIVGSIVTKLFLIPQVDAFYKSIHLQQPAISPLTYLNLYIVLGIVELILAAVLFLVGRKHNHYPRPWLIIGVIGLAFTSLVQPITEVYLTYTAFDNLVKQTRLSTIDVTPPLTVQVTPTPTPEDTEVLSFSEKAQSLLAEELSVKEDEIRVISAEKKTWNDGSLGCPKPGMMYAQNIVEGYQVVLEVDHKQYDYHAADSLDSLFLCEK